MRPRLRGRGRFRRRLARFFGIAPAEGDRLLRRGLHAGGALGILYYALPARAFVLLPTADVLLLLLAIVWVLEALRLAGLIEMPTIRAVESRRPASYAMFGTAIVAVLLLAPRPVGFVVLLGAAAVDPILGELRASPAPQGASHVLGWALYTGIAAVCLLSVTNLRPEAVAAASAFAAAVAVAVEGPRAKWVDDDVTIVVAPALALVALGVAVPAAFGPLGGGVT